MTTKLLEAPRRKSAKKKGKPKVSREPQLPLNPGWVQVHAATKWTPKGVDDILEGVYAGARTSNGSYGPRIEHMVRTAGGTFYPSGIHANDLFRSASPAIDEPVRVVFKGQRGTSNDHTMNIFELYVRRVIVPQAFADLERTPTTLPPFGFQGEE